MGHNDSVTSASSGTLFLEEVFFKNIKDYIVNYTLSLKGIVNFFSLKGIISLFSKHIKKYILTLTRKF